MMRRLLDLSFLALASVLLLFPATPTLGQTGKDIDEVTVYSSREPEFVEPLLKVFEQLTRIKLNLVYIKDGLVERLAHEGEASPADLVLTNELSQLLAAKANGLTRPSQTQALTDHIPAALRDPDGHWFGLSQRARIVLAASTRFEHGTIRYEELADPRFKGRICLRSGRHPYNVGLIASMIAHLGEPAAEQWLRGLKANLAMKPSGGDRDQILNVAAGKCDLALVNSYYLGSALSADAKPELRTAAATVKPIFPNAADRGSHVSISGMAMTSHARNPDNAALLMDFLVSEPAQFIYASDNHEYPIHPAVTVSDRVAGFGRFRPDALPLGAIAENSDKAVQLIERVGFDNGPGS